MKGTLNKSKIFPLVTILVGTTILAIPAALGTYVLIFDDSTTMTMDAASSANLLWISIAGFVLYAGYILTAVFKRHSSIFWFFSGLYNFALTCCYIYFAVFEIANNDGLFILILPVWTLFVTVSSAYYFYFSLKTNKLSFC